MDCRETLNLISSHLDGALSRYEQAALNEHVAGCMTCAREMELQKQIACALREIGRDEIEAPPELCGLVMARLRAERRTVLPWLPAVWRKALAVAAAIMLLAGGSASLNADLKMAAIEKITFRNEHVATVADNHESMVQTPVGNPGVDANQTSESVQPYVDVNRPVINGNGNSPDSTQVDNIDTSNKENSVITDVADAKPKPSAGLQRALLSSGVKVTSTVLKLAVDDLDVARTKSVTLAAEVGAGAQIFPEQSSGKKIVVIRLSVSSDQAPGFFTELTRIGALIDRQDESRDITSIYNETMIQYHDLQSQIGSTRDAEEQRKLEAQTASYKQQLEAWDAETGKRVIMLWLESR
ncbi:MAG: Anti-sigma-W factor RsiW [Pelotomaculum sp. PtaB.Bin104]|nr:MAG: Anti-sigma-W factor RsiW [Pelotomaculum sp. PtaB.Bin104]